MNKDVAQRLIDNLEAELIRHDQNIWLTDHTFIFEIKPEERWSCATAGCAAGFIWLAEAAEGSVFGSDKELVFEPGDYDFDLLEKWDSGLLSFQNLEGPYFQMLDKGIKISVWAGNKLGISREEAHFLFYQFGNTQETIDRIKFLMSGGNCMDYLSEDKLEEEDDCDL